MKTQPGFAGLFLALVLVTSAPLNGSQPGRFPWLTDLAEARHLAAEVGKPLLIAFRCVP